MSLFDWSNMSAPSNINLGILSISQVLGLAAAQSGEPLNLGDGCGKASEMTE